MDQSELDALLKMLKEKGGDNSPFAASDLVYSIGDDNSDYARGGYASKGFVKPVADVAEEAIAAAKRLLGREHVPVKAPDPYVKGVNDRKPELEQAIKDFYAGNITRGEYDDIVRNVLPVTPYEFIPRPAPENLAVDALNAAKKEKYGLNRDIYQEGDPVAMRLDIPAYLNLPNSQWVNSIHDPKGIHPTTYDSASAARNVEFVVPENKARATGEGGPKAPYAVMRGENIPITADEAVAKAKDIMSGPLPSQWQQVGMDPRRHSYFYTRDDRMLPVTNADEVLQIGPVVYAKNPKVGDRGDFGYASGGYADGGQPREKDWLTRFFDEYKNIQETTRQQARDYLISKGMKPEAAEREANNVAGHIERNKAIGEMLIPQSMTDLGLMAITGANPMARALGTALIAADPSEAEASFLGRFSQTANKNLLKMAEDILRGGGNPLKETGWFKDPQGLPSDWRGAKANPAWKYEISDVPSKLKIGPEEFSQGKLFHAGEIIEHPELFEAYPDLKTMSVIPNSSIEYRGHYDPRQRNIALRTTDMDSELFKSTLLHELQHGIQAKEMFVPGGSPLSEFGAAGHEHKQALIGADYLRWLQQNNLPDKFVNFDEFLKIRNLNPMDKNQVPGGIGHYIWNKTPEDLEKRALEISKQYMGTLNPIDAYKRIHGENEAYNVEERLRRGITPDQTRTIDPQDTATWNFDQTFQAPGR